MAQGSYYTACFKDKDFFHEALGAADFSLQNCLSWKQREADQMESSSPEASEVGKPGRICGMTHCSKQHACGDGVPLKRIKKLSGEKSVHPLFARKPKHSMDFLKFGSFLKNNHNPKTHKMN